MSDVERKRLVPVDQTTRELYMFSGNQCAFPGCENVLLQQNGHYNCEVAHIHGVKRSAARGEHNLTNEQLRDPSNLVLMCLNHHAEIDDKKLESTYTVEAVQKMKADHEGRFRELLYGLDRIVDITADLVTYRPQNLCALEGFCSENDTAEEIQECLDMATPFVDSLIAQSPALRDLISLILIHGSVHAANGHKKKVKAPITKISGVATGITPDDFRQRALSLERDGLLSIDEDFDGLRYFELVDPTAKDVGWDLFVSIYELAARDAGVIRRIIDDLDFSVLDV